MRSYSLVLSWPPVVKQRTFCLLLWSSISQLVGRGPKVGGFDWVVTLWAVSLLVFYLRKKKEKGILKYILSLEKNNIFS